MSAPNGPGPSWDVDVTIEAGRPTYGNFAASVYGWETRAWWEELGDLLGGRPGWRCTYDADGLLWSFGAGGSSLFNITAPDDSSDFESGTFSLFDYAAEESLRFHGTTALREWLEANESRHADHLRNLRDLASTNDWAVLATMGTALRVTYDSGSYIATFPTIPLESTFAADLASLLANAREAIAAAYDAPPEVALRIKVTAFLDDQATDALS